MPEKNILKNESSPYLLQHADNPVNWYPWGDKAFAAARRENKPVFLSIGYSTCHWCHVMARESFEDQEVASLINRVFIPIKVDREERPEIDKIYMNVCQLLTGSGGWPLTIFLTPDKEPFYAGTYIPKNNKYGRKGIIELIKDIEKLWQEKEEEIIKSAGNITGRLREDDLQSEEIPHKKNLDDTYYELIANYDNQYGGFGYTNKFPTPHSLLFLLRSWYRKKEERALEMVEDTLMEIRKGGIYDHLAYGFHRYTMDREWLIPHFEKMLYDQALLAYTYTETYQATGKEIYAETCKEIFKYITEKLYSPGNAFYSAEDAESEGEEGKYYLWEKDEINNILTEKEREEFYKVFNLNNINEFTHDDVNKFTLSLKNIKYKNSNIYKQIREKLYQYREKRSHPFLDDKILTDWNGLIIAALARAGWVYNNKYYLDTAQKTFEFIEKNLLSNDGGLYHCYCKGKVSVQANIDDYSFLIWGLIELYEATFNYKYIKITVNLVDHIMENFWDEKNGGFYFASKNKEDILIRQKEIYDGAVPSGNSIALWNLIRLAHLTENMKFEEMGEQLALSFLAKAEKFPSNYCQYFSALDSYIAPFTDIVITGYKDNKNTKEMFNILRENYIPNKVIMFKDQENIKNSAESLEKYDMLNNNTTAYVCKNYSCSPPTNDKSEMLYKIINK